MTPTASVPPRLSAASRRLLRSSCLGLAATALGLWLAEPEAHAQPEAHTQATTEDRVAAESLFSDARRLMQIGDYTSACPKLEASRRLEAGLGTTLNLGHCYEKLGRTASAWAEFRSAAAEAQRAGDGARKAAALERAEALEPRLSRLQINTAQTNVVVLRNGEPLSSAVIGSAIPVDPGSYQLEARAPGKLAWQRTVAIDGAGALVEVDIPALTDDPETSSGAVLPAPADTTDARGTQRTVAWALGGVGIAAVAIGTTFTVLAASSWSKAESGCRDLPYECSPGAVGRADDADRYATLATIGFAAGGAALGASLVLFLTSADDGTGAELALTPRAVSLRGRF
jgi:hypothetical protein